MIYFNVYYFKDNKKYFIKEINFSVKLHDMQICNCSRILQNIKFHKIPQHKLAFVLEKQCWDEDPTPDDPPFIYIEKNKFFTKNHLIKLFNESKIKSRSHIHKLIINMSHYISNNLCNVNKLHHTDYISISKCNNLMNREGVKNSGLIFVSNQSTMEKIAHIYNEKIKSDNVSEFNKLCISKIDDLKLIDEQYYNHTVLSFIKSSVYHKFLNRNLYTILGFDNKTNIFSFSFGKNEWYHDDNESSYACAKRELFEEFHILYSGKYTDKIVTNRCHFYISHLIGNKIYFSVEKKVIIILD
jgi:hypothetical protein